MRAHGVFRVRSRRFQGRVTAFADAPVVHLTLGWDPRVSRRIYQGDIFIRRLGNVCLIVTRDIENDADALWRLYGRCGNFLSLGNAMFWSFLYVVNT